MGFRAIVVDRDADGRTHAGVREIALDDLPEGEVTVAVDWSTINYKDGLCLGPGAGLVRKYPHVPGVDFAGRVEASSDPRYRPGDAVVLTGWRVGEAHWGGYAQKARVRADWLVPLPDGLTLRQTMAIGTAGLTAMLAVMALEGHGLDAGARAGAGDRRRRRGRVGGGGRAGAARLRGRGGDRAAGGRGLPARARARRGSCPARSWPSRARGRSSSRPGPACVDAVGGAMLSRVTEAAQVPLRGGGGRQCRRRRRAAQHHSVPAPRRQPARHRQRAAALRRTGGAPGRGWCATSTSAKLDAMILPATLAELPGLGRGS